MEKLDGMEDYQERKEVYVGNEILDRKKESEVFKGALDTVEGAFKYQKYFTRVVEEQKDRSSILFKIHAEHDYISTEYIVEYDIKSGTYKVISSKDTKKYHTDEATQRAGYLSRRPNIKTEEVKQNGIDNQTTLIVHSPQLDESLHLLRDRAMTAVQGGAEDLVNLVTSVKPIRTIVFNNGKNKEITLVYFRQLKDGQITDQYVYFLEMPSGNEELRYLGTLSQQTPQADYHKIVTSMTEDVDPSYLESRRKAIEETDPKFAMEFYPRDFPPDV